MPQFGVKWQAIIDASCHEEAAEIALDNLRTPNNIATIFVVVGVEDSVEVTYDAHEKILLSDERGDDYEYN